MRSVEQRVIEIIARAAMIPPSRITPETKLSDLDVGSLEYIECVLALEDAFQVEMSESSLWELHSVRDVIEAVRRALAVNA